MAHPQNKHHRFVIGMLKGLKRAYAHHGYVQFESLRPSTDPHYKEDAPENYIQDSKIHRDTTTRRAHTAEHDEHFSEKARFKALKDKELLKNLELDYEPVSRANIFINELEELCMDIDFEPEPEFSYEYTY